jgi:hypothetical protein
MPFSCSTRSTQHRGLRARVHVADLIEEQRAAIGELELAAALLPVNAPFSWPNSSLSISSLVMAAQLSSTN